MAEREADGRSQHQASTEVEVCPDASWSRLQSEALRVTFDCSGVDREVLVLEPGVEPGPKVCNRVWSDVILETGSDATVTARTMPLTNVAALFNDEDGVLCAKAHDHIGEQAGTHGQGDGYALVNGRAHSELDWNPDATRQRDLQAEPIGCVFRWRVFCGWLQCRRLDHWMGSRF